MVGLDFVLEWSFCDSSKKGVITSSFVRDDRRDKLKKAGKEDGMLGTM